MHVSVFNPASPQASELLWLWNVCMWVCGFVLAAVTLPMLYIIVRYRQRGNQEPPKFRVTRISRSSGRSSRSLSSGFLFVLSITTARAVDRPVRREARHRRYRPSVVVGGAIPRGERDNCQRNPCSGRSGDADRNRSGGRNSRFLGSEAGPKDRCDSRSPQFRLDSCRCNPATIRGRARSIAAHNTPGCVFALSHRSQKHTILG